MSKTFIIIALVLLFFYLKKRNASPMSHFGATNRHPTSAQIIDTKNKTFAKIRPTIENACKSIGLKFNEPVQGSNNTKQINLGYCT